MYGTVHTAYMIRSTQQDSLSMYYSLYDKDNTVCMLGFTQQPGRGFTDVDVAPVPAG